MCVAAPLVLNPLRHRVRSLPSTSPSSSKSALYVATTGLDSNPGTQALPLKTLLAALSRVQDHGVIYVQPGTYPQTRSLAITKTWVTIQAVSSGKAIVENGGFSGALFSIGARGATLAGLKLDGKFVSGCECASSGVVEFDGAVAFDEHDFAVGQLAHLDWLAERFGHAREAEHSGRGADGVNAAKQAVRSLRVRRNLFGRAQHRPERVEPSRQTSDELGSRPGEPGFVLARRGRTGTGGRVRHPPAVA